MTQNMATAKTSPVFVCQRCGQCCRGRGGIWLHPKRLQALATYLGLDLNTLIATYLEPDGSLEGIHQNLLNGVAARETDWPLIQVGLAPEGYCAFFDQTRQACVIHPLKPLACRAWPFYWTLLNSQSGFLEAQNVCPALEAWDYPTFLAAFKATGQKWPSKNLKQAELLD
jgi:Fe-S-cluster containining protein